MSILSLFGFTSIFVLEILVVVDATEHIFEIVITIYTLAYRILIVLNYKYYLWQTSKSSS